MRSVSHCQFTGSGVIAHAEDEKGVQHRVFLQDARAGVSFPTGGLPGYYVLIGRQFDTISTGKAKLLYLCEGEDIMHEPLFQSLTDACTKFKCRTLYAHLPRVDRRGGIGGYDDLWRYLRNKRLGINMMPAPAAEDEDYGKALIREYIKDRAIDVPEYEDNPTILRGQLREITEDGDAKHLYAFHALRLVIAGFVKFNQGIPYSPETRKSSAKANPKGWT